MIRDLENKVLLETKNLSVGYNKSILLDGINIKVEAGKIVTLIGPNGSGKSTILKSIIRELSAISGNIVLMGEDMNSMKAADIAKSMSMVMTLKPKAELMTCREIVESGRYPYTGNFGILSSKDSEIVDYAINLVGLKHIEGRLFDQVSDGQKQCFMLARAICQEPKVLVLDEPSSFLDIKYKLDIIRIIHNLVDDKKMAVIMSLHELDIARSISDVIVCVDGKHIGRIGSPDEVFSGGYVQGLYGIDKDSFDEKTGALILPKYK